MTTGFAGRLFGPGLPGVGVEATGHWAAGRLHLAAAGRDFVAGPLAIEASGFNAGQVRASWSDSDGDYAFFVAPAARATFAAAAPPEVAARLGGAARAEAGLDRRFRLGWLALGLFLLLPFLALGVFLARSDAVAEWLVGFIPLEHEQKLGDLVLARTRTQMKLVDSGPAVAAVRAIGERLVPGSRLRYRWFVAERPEINAFAAPGGVVVVFSGLIKAAESAEEVAGVLAHEVAHAELRHSLRAMAKSLGLRALLSVALGDVSGGVLADAALNLTELKFSRDAERDADGDGLRRLVAAGIDPNGMTRFFARLAAQEGRTAPPALLSTHPASAERLAELRAAVAALGAVKSQPLAVGWVEAQAALPPPSGSTQDLPVAPDHRHFDEARTDVVGRRE